MKKYLFLVSALALSAIGAKAQVSASDYYNAGGQTYDFSNAETVTADPVSGVGYVANNSGEFYHHGPAAATLTVNGLYNAYNPNNNGLVGTTATPGVDYFQGLDGAKTTAQEIAGNTAPTFGILQLDNGANQINITNSAGANVGFQTNFMNGITTTVRSNAGTGALRFLNGATYTNSNLGDAQYVNGYVGKTGTQAFTFPVGNQAGTDLRTLAISAPATATDQLSVAYWQGDVRTALDPTGGAHSRSALSTAGTAGTTKLVSVSPIGFWDWIGSGTSSLTVTVSLPALTGTGGYTSAASVRLVGFNTTTSQWENLSGSTGASGLAEGSTLSGTVPNMANYSAIGFGSVSSVPLPITLLSFSGKAAGCSVALSWQSATEEGSDYYAVQRSADGISWKEIKRVAAAGMSTSLLDYQTIDGSPLSGMNYYRLLMADKSSEIRYSNVLRVTPDCGAKASIIAIAPNPVISTVRINGLESGNTIKIYDNAGRLMYSAAATGIATVIDCEAWAPGTYQIQVLQGDKAIAGKQIVKQ